jgi:ATP-dependent Lon protease
MSLASTDQLDQLANAAFPGRVVRKDLVRRTKVGSNVPVYVLEYLLGKYCASDDPETVEIGLAEVNRQLTEHFVWPDEAGKAQAKLKQRGKHRVIDKVKVRFAEGEGRFWAELANFDSRYVHVPEETVYKYDRLLEGGVWAQVDLVYNEPDEGPIGSRRPFWIESLRPIQVAAFNLEEYRESRALLSRNDWLDLLVRSIGLEPTQYDTRVKLLVLVRLIPMAERNYNLVELGPRGTGKSFVYRETTPNAILVSGGKTTVPQLFGYLDRRRNPGLIPIWDVVAFDEVAGLEFADSTAVQMLKDYMEAGSYSRGRDETPADASIVYLGNTDQAPDVLVRTSHLFADLPRAMIDPAFLDRLHFYLPGWEVPKMERSSFASAYGLVSDYLSEAVRELRRFSYSDVLGRDFRFGDALHARDEKAVRKTVSGLLKLLHPDERWTRSELQEYLELALEGRRRVKQQLKKLAPHEYGRTAFSFVEVNTNHEEFVPVPEQPEDLGLDGAVAEPEAEASVDEVKGASLAELVGQPESALLEFKSSLRYDRKTGGANRSLEQAVVKSVAGLLNGRGGLLIGVADDGEILGIDDDFPMLSKRKDLDGFENHLTTLLEQGIGAAATSTVEVSFDALDGRRVCRVNVRPSPAPVWTHIKGEQDTFYVRLGNSTRPLGPRETHEYISQRFR